jgi:AcrR family transcriptional regulator
VISLEIKDRIIESAYELFAIKGYEKTTIGEIIKIADCSKGGFYHHFKSKEEILEVIITNYIDDLAVHFESILSNKKDSFIDRFNAIYKTICQIKIKQLNEWSKVKNVFIFTGNDRIIRQLEKQFKIATTRTYLEVLQAGKEQGIIDIEYPEIFAELCTREVLWINEAAGKLIISEDQNEYLMFEKLLDFSEALISHALGLDKNEVKFRDAALEYLKVSKESYLAHKEGY